MSPILILIIGLVLIFLEFYLPGAVMGTIGTLMVISAIIFTTLETHSFIYVILFILASIAGVIITIKTALWHIQRTKKNHSIFLDTDQEGYRASSYDETLIGRTGKALVDMRPGGRILIEDEKYQALSISGFIPKGSTVIVVSGQGESLNVKLKIEGSP